MNFFDIILATVIKGLGSGHDLAKSIFGSPPTFAPMGDSLCVLQGSAFAQSVAVSQPIKMIKTQFPDGAQNRPTPATRNLTLSDQREDDMRRDGHFRSTSATMNCDFFVVVKVAF